MQNKYGSKNFKRIIKRKLSADIYQAMKFGHIAIRIKDLSKMLDFYCNKIGLKEAFRIFNDDDSVRIVYLHISNEQYLELCLGGKDPLIRDDKRSLGVRHICFNVKDLYKTRANLKLKGIIFDSDILSLRDNNLACFLSDPEGNRIELMQIQPGSPHKKFEENL